MYTSGERVASQREVRQFVFLGLGPNLAHTVGAQRAAGRAGWLGSPGLPASGVPGWLAGEAMPAGREGERWCQTNGACVLVVFVECFWMCMDVGCFWISCGALSWSGTRTECRTRCGAAGLPRLGWLSARSRDPIP